ncbi:L,D-transpeptidase catalytic domain protein, partial [Methylobacterium sp. A54F]
CALGRGGIRVGKREGDGASPRGRFRLRGGAYRPDRVGARPGCPLRLRATRPNDGWCDDPADRRYNRPVRLPVRARTELMWREDVLYDVVLDLDYNRAP